MFEDFYDWYDGYEGRISTEDLAAHLDPIIAILTADRDEALRLSEYWKRLDHIHLVQANKATADRDAARDSQRAGEEKLAERAGFGASSYLNVIFDRMPGDEAPRFIDVRDAADTPIKDCDWVERCDGLFSLRLAAAPWAERLCDEYQSDVETFKAERDEARELLDFEQTRLDGAIPMLDELRAEIATLNAHIMAAARVIVSAPSPSREAELERQVEGLREVLEKVTSTATLLQQNSVACAVRHRGLNTSKEGLPGWLATCEQIISRARAALQVQP